MRKLSWSELAPGEREELETLVKGRGAAFLPDHDWLPFAVSGLLLGGAGVVALWTQSEGMMLEALGYIPALVREVGVLGALPALRSVGMFLAALGLTAWMAYFLATNLGRRGSAATSYGCVQVKGRRLRLMRHADVTRIARRVVRTKKTSFTVLELFGRGDEKLTFLVHGGWANTATAAIESARGAPVPSSEG